MKSLLGLILFFFATLGWAQIPLKNVTLHFLPYMAQTPMVLGETTSPNAEGTPFILERAQFYVSGIELVHDGGQVLPLTNTYLLVNANQTDYPVGQLPVEVLEGIRFKVGIDETTNHADPTLYPTGNPLALQVPSMHWGWAAGYRFVALEGGAADGTTHFEYHAVGDEFLTAVEIPITSTVSSDNLDATLYTDYADFMNGMAINDIVHGGGHTIEVLMLNINKYDVFSSDVPTAITNITPNAATAYNAPNPFSTYTTLNYNCPTINGASLVIYDMTGRVVYQQQQLSPVGDIALSLPNAATYRYVLYDAKQQAIYQGTMIGLGK